MLKFLTSTQLKFWEQNGYLILPNLIPQQDLSSIKSRAFELIDNWQPRQSHSIFTTTEQDRIADESFMDSASSIEFFLEEKGSLNNKKNSVNKIGHAIHDLDPVFQNFSYRKEYKQILDDLGYKIPNIVQSMYILKSAKIGGEVKPHQDSSYIISSPSSCMGIWVAIEDATPENACMFAAPGSHRIGTKLFWERKESGMVFSGSFEYDTSEKVCLEAEAGTVVLLHGDLVHWSYENTSEASRHAYTLHVVESLNTRWSETNWLQRTPELPFRNWV